MSNMVHGAEDGPCITCTDNLSHGPAPAGRNSLEVGIAESLCQITIMLVKQIWVCTALMTPSANIVCPTQHNQLLYTHSKAYENLLQLCYALLIP